MHSEHDDEVAGFSVVMTSFLLLSLGNLLLFSLPFLEGVLLSCSNKQVPIFVMHMTYIGMCVCVYIYVRVCRYMYTTCWDMYQSMCLCDNAIYLYVF